jgi:hemerythrin-like domain-containing protein
MNDRDDRRAFFSMASAGLLLAACRKEEHAEVAPSPPDASAQPAPTAKAGQAPKEERGEGVGAVEDLMREHGVIRRILVVYREAALQLRATPASVPLESLHKAARLLRTFAEDYHEKQLEEAHIFPAVKTNGGDAASEIDTLVAQHQRGREITDFVVAVTQKTIEAIHAESLARALEGFARMYEEHSAQEDTVIFPAWKKTLSPTQLDEMGDLFESIEKRTFGKDGFDDAVTQAKAIERTLGIDLAAMMPARPSKP